MASRPAAVGTDLAAAVEALRGELGQLRAILQDVHDGLAGVRTDLTALPEQLGPVVTGAVARALANQAGGGGLATQLGEVEARLAGHVDDAVLALAEALRGRSAVVDASDGDVDEPAVGEPGSAEESTDEVVWDDDGPQDWELEEAVAADVGGEPDPPPVGDAPTEPAAGPTGLLAADVLPPAPPERPKRRGVFRRGG